MNHCAGPTLHATIAFPGVAGFPAVRDLVDFGTARVPGGLHTEPNDRHRLIAGIEGRTALNGRFSDASPLKIWMRHSDLDNRRFHNAWCLIRTD